MPSSIRVSFILTAAIAGAAAVGTVSTTTAPQLKPDPATVRAHGSDLFAQHCAVCHDPAIEGAPDASAFETFPQPFIVQALKIGDMKPNATGLSDDDIAAIAAYLTAQ
jgi:mono/diheme cytochrome c family protein